MAAPLWGGAASAASGASPAPKPLQFVAVIEPGPDVSPAIAARIEHAVDDWSLPGGPVLRVPFEDVELARAEARRCLDTAECRKRLVAKGLAFVVFLDVVPTSDGLHAMRVLALDTVGGDENLAGYVEFGKEGPEPHLKNVLPFLAKSPRGEVAFKLDPPGCLLHLNGWKLPAGTTGLAHLVPGAYRLRADHEGRASLTREFTVGVIDDAPPPVVDVLLPPLGGGGDGGGGGRRGSKTALFAGIGIGAAVAAIAGGIVLGVVLMRSAGRCDVPLDCGPW